MKQESNMKYTDKKILHCKEGDIEYLQFKALNGYPIKHAITLRHGGVSTSHLASLNYNIKFDEKENVIENLNRICQKLQIEKKNVYKAHQNHTDRILILKDNNKEMYQFEKFSVEDYDAYITNQKGIALMVTTADCNPIIIYDPVCQVIANIHSGWKGTIQKIYLKTCETMIKEFGSKASDLIVCIGPSIRKCCFSSEEESFKEKFTSNWDYEESSYIAYEKNHKRFHIDLIYLIQEDLKKIGVKKIVTADICTVCSHEDFFSYRIATKSKQKEYGLMSTIVTLN